MPRNSAPTKDPAQSKGREMAKERGVEHLTHRKEKNTIQERNTYPRGRDPRRSKGLRGSTAPRCSPR